MTSVPIADLPTEAVVAWVRLRDALHSLLGDDLVAVWGCGARAWPDPPKALGDVDSLVIVARPPDPAMGARLRDLKQAVAREAGVDLDLTHVLASDARDVELPLDRVRTDGWRHVTWAFHRAHALAGRYVHVQGARPEELLRAPTWPELERALREEVAHLERHVAAGDDDLYETSYAILNGSRILRSLETRDVVSSKRGAASWALEHLPQHWHAAIRAALRAYDGQATDADHAALREAMAPFVGTVRERMASP